MKEEPTFRPLSRRTLLETVKRADRLVSLVYLVCLVCLVERD